MDDATWEKHCADIEAAMAKVDTELVDPIECLAQEPWELVYDMIDRETEEPLVSIDPSPDGRKPRIIVPLVDGRKFIIQVSIED